VVLPFESLTDASKEKNLANGITEDIITDLSRISNLLVIASNTSAAYKDRQVNLEKIGKDLNVSYALKGSLRQLGENVRVNVHLVSTKTGFNVWAQRYDRKMTELFSVQGDVSKQIVTALAVKTTSQENRLLAQRATSNLKAYDFFQEGQRYFKFRTKDDNERARELYRNAINLDPNYGRAYGALALTLVIDYQNSWTTSPVEALDRALEMARIAVELDNSIPQTHWALSFVHLWRKEYDQAKKAAEEAIAIAPNYADGYSLLSLINSYVGNAEKGIEFNNRAFRLNPYYSFEYLISSGLAYYTLGDYASAIKTLEEGYERNPNSQMVSVLLAASYLRANRMADAQWVVAELQTGSPTTTITNLQNTSPIANPEIKQALVEDLSMAGLPE
jgi:adenylate cyclase